MCALWLSRSPAPPRPPGLHFACVPCSYSATNSDVVPSFVLMDIQGSNVVTYVYQLLENDEVKVEKLDFSK